jgi:acetyl-CoA decarbonylase/synthase complex subunit gamma
VVNGELAVDNCPPVTKEEYRVNFSRLEDLMAPPVRTVQVGTGDRAMKLGGKYVLYRHEFTYNNPTPIAIDVSDDLPEEELTARVRAIADWARTPARRNCDPLDPARPGRIRVGGYCRCYPDRSAACALYL